MNTSRPVPETGGDRNVVPAASGASELQAAAGVDGTQDDPPDNPGDEYVPV